MITNWFKRLAVSAVVEDINSNGRVRRALRGGTEGEWAGTRVMNVSSVSQEEFSRRCQNNREKLILPLMKKFSDGTISITADEVVVGCPTRGEVRLDR